MSVLLIAVGLICIAYSVETIRAYFKSENLGAEDNSIRNAIISMVIAVVSILMANIVDARKKHVPIDDSEAIRTAAYLQSKPYVEQILKAPSSADFPWYQRSFVGHSSGNIYYVHAYVDAQNSYGAKLRVKYLVTMEYKGGEINDPSNWIATNATIE